MSSSNATGSVSLQILYDKKYLQFVSEVLSSSRYYTNLRDQWKNQAFKGGVGDYNDKESTVLFCRETVSQNEISPEDSYENQNVFSDTVADRDCDDYAEEVYSDTDYLFNNDLNYANDSGDSENNDDLTSCSTKRPALNKKANSKKSKQKRKRKARTTFDDFENSNLENDIREIVKSSIAIDIRKQPHTNIFSLKDEDLQELRDIYGNEADAILRLEQKQQLTFQKACDKITSNLHKYSFSKK